jgi:hypothetical protein
MNREQNVEEIFENAKEPHPYDFVPSMGEEKPAISEI